MRAETHSPNDAEDKFVGVLERVRQALLDLRYGEVRLLVHDGVVVQVERTEKLRMTRAGPN